MDRIRIRGGNPLSGTIPIGGAKNAALPLMAAGLLTAERLTLTNVPRLADIDTMALLLAQHGVAVERLDNDGRALSIGGAITSTEAPYDIVRKMRASVLVLGPLVARCGEARVSLPGGCAIGTRPIDLERDKGGEVFTRQIEIPNSGDDSGPPSRQRLPCRARLRSCRLDACNPHNNPDVDRGIGSPVGC